jgi:predicted RNase H-like HicB family nuclease/predicted RNA binding protein YcfA (HicA-like mRNA interferase family)
MTRADKLLNQILRGSADANISFSGMVQLLKRLGFQERIKGSHHIFIRDGVAEILNLNLVPGSANRIRRSRSAMLRLTSACREKPMPKYEIIFYWSQADEALVAEVPELPGCTADGKTYKEALASVEVVIQEWMETAKELGRPIPAPRGRLAFA